MPDQAMPSMPSASRAPTLDCPRNTQIANLLQHLLNTIIQITTRILISRLSIKILLNLRHTRIRLCAKAQLNLDQGLETGIQIWHAQIDELGQFVEELLVELFVCLLCDFGFALCARKFCRVLVGFLDEALDFGAHGVVVEKFVVALFDAFVYVGEVGAETGDGV